MTTQPGPYNPNIPANRTDSLATSQPQLLNNFLQLYNIFSNNHIPLDAASNAGNHTIIQLLEQSNAIQTNTGEINVYTKDVEGQTDQIFLKYQGPSGQEFQFTTYQIYQLEPTNTQTSYFTFLPDNVLVYFGVVNVKKGHNKLNLRPAIGKHLIAPSFTPIVTIPNFAFSNSFKPTIALEFEGDYLTSFDLGLKFNPDAPAKMNYFVMVNL